MENILGVELILRRPENVHNAVDTTLHGNLEPPYKEFSPQAVYWFHQAAKQGHAGAQFNLGVIYAKGQGIPQDNQQATHWFHLAAKQGHSGAQFNLGVMYSKGNTSSNDDELSITNVM